MWRSLRVSGYKKMSKKPNRGNELGNLFSFAEEYLIVPSLIPVNQGMRLGGWQNSLICMKLSAQASTSFHCVCSLEWNAAKVFRAEHTRRQVAATRCGDKSQLQVTLCVRENFFVKVSVSETEFCRHNKSHKIKSDWICTTPCGNKTLLLRQRFPQKFSRTRKLLQQLIARPVHTERFCCRDLLQQHVA